MFNKLTEETKEKFIPWIVIIGGFILVFILIGICTELGYMGQPQQEVDTYLHGRRYNLTCLDGVEYILYKDSLTERLIPHYKNETDIYLCDRANGLIYDWKHEDIPSE